MSKTVLRKRDNIGVSFSGRRSNRLRYGDHVQSILLRAWVSNAFVALLPPRFMFPPPVKFCCTNKFSVDNAFLPSMNDYRLIVI